MRLNGFDPDEIPLEVPEEEEEPSSAEMREQRRSPSALGIVRPGDAEWLAHRIDHGVIQEWSRR
jgi:hypothetical protein